MAGDSTKLLVIRNGTLIDGSGDAAAEERRARHRRQPHPQHRAAAAGHPPRGQDGGAGDRRRGPVDHARPHRRACPSFLRLSPSSRRRARARQCAARAQHDQGGARRADGAALGRHRHLRAGRHLFHRCRRARGGAAGRHRGAAHPLRRPHDRAPGAASRTTSRPGSARPTMRSACSATTRPRWSPRCGARTSTASISSRWPTAAPARRRCWRREEIAAVAAEAHRRNLRVAIHSRGAGSTRAAAEAGVDWIVHADLATEADLEAVAKAGIPILPTATFLWHRDRGRQARRAPSRCSSTSIA